MAPQPPQLFGSLFVSTQLRAQRVKVPVQPLTHCPALQTSFAPHAVVHAPQCAGSVENATHVPLQSVIPASQTHPVALQISSERHAVVHEPQWAGSLPKSTQPPEHVWSGAVHDVAH